MLELLTNYDDKFFENLTIKIQYFENFNISINNNRKMHIMVLAIENVLAKKQQQTDIIQAFMNHTWMTNIGRLSTIIFVRFHVLWESIVIQNIFSNLCNQKHGLVNVQENYGLCKEKFAILAV